MADEVKKAGLEMVVEGLTKFTSDMEKINSKIQDLRPSQTLLQKGFDSLWEAAKNFGESIVNLATVTLGVLLRDAIRAVIDWVKEMVSSMVEEIRLNRLNLNELKDSTEEYIDVSAKAIEMTQEQLDWVIKLAASSPFDAEDVTRTYTLARSYGFTADEAANLTESILEFSAGMGLTNQEMERIIVNFGQLEAQGKLNSQELRDLARGAFVPVNDVMEIMAKNMTESGAITADYTEEIKKLKEQLQGYEEDLAVALLRQSEFTDTTKESTILANDYRIDELKRKIAETTGLLEDYQDKNGKAVEITLDNIDQLKKQGLLGADAVDQFISAFVELVGEDFKGASEDMSQAFKPAVENLQDLIRGVGGLKVVKPILAELGKRAAAFADAFTEDPERWDKFVTNMDRLGKALADVVAGVLGLAPSTEDLADNIVDFIGKAADWVEENRDNIVGFFEHWADVIKNDIVPWIKDVLWPAIKEFFNWIYENKDLFLQVFVTLGDVLVNDIIPVIVNDVIPAIKSMLEWISENKETIKGWIDTLVRVFLVLQTVGTILNIVGGAILAVIGFVLSLTAKFISIIGTILSLGVSMSALIAGLAVLGAMFAFWGDQIKETWNQLWFILWEVSKSRLKFIADLISGAFELWKTIVITNWTTVLSYWRQKLDEMRTSLSNAFANMRTSVETKMEEIRTSIRNKIEEAKNSIKNIDWAEVGTSIIRGIAAGITGGAWMIIEAAQSAAQSAFNAAMDLLGAHSPSRLFMGLGENMMEGLALGIQKAAGLAVGSMQGAISVVASQATPSVTNMTNNTVTNNFSLNVTSNAQQEPLIQDYNMLQSLAGV